MEKRFESELPSGQRGSMTSLYESAARTGHTENCAGTRIRNCITPLNRVTSWLGLGPR